MYRQNYPEATSYQGAYDTMNRMTDSHTRVSYKHNPNFLERIGGGCMGIFIGIAVIMGSSGLLWYNEGRAVQTAKSLDEGLNHVISLKNIQVTFQENNGKLVHLTGSLQTDKVLNDNTFGVGVHAVKLRRNVEMYQWVENKNTREINEGNGQTRVETTYSYSKEWRSSLVRSQSFDNPSNHHNPSSMLYPSQMLVADSVQVGNFYLSQGLIEAISNYRKLIPTKAKDSTVKLVDGVYYTSQTPMNPKIGDLKITFDYAGFSGEVGSQFGPPEHASIIAKQQGQQLTKYDTKAGDALEMLELGEFTAEELFAKAHATNAMMTWLLRMAGWFLMFVGFGMSTSLLTILVDWLPIVRELVSIGVTILNLTMSISLSLTVIAIAWIRYRPLLGITILALALVPFILSKRRAQNMKSNH